MKTKRNWVALGVILTAFVSVLVISRTRNEAPRPIKESASSHSAPATPALVPTPATVTQPTEPSWVAINREFDRKHPREVAPPVYIKPQAKIDTLAQGDNPLSLGSDQIAAIVASYEKISQARLALEKKVLEVKKMSDGQVLITIPEYRAEGAALLTQFATEVKLRLGDAQGERFYSMYERSIRYLNKGMGEYEQKVLIDRLPADRGYQVVHEFTQSHGPDPREKATRTMTSEISSTDFSAYSQFKDYLP